MKTTAIVTTAIIITLGIYDLVAVVSGGDASITVSQFLVNVGFDAPMVVFAIGFVCGHLFGYMKPPKSVYLLRGEKPKSIMRHNAEKDPSYCPYCLRCTGFVRMVKVKDFYWECHCGAKHDERQDDE